MNDKQLSLLGLCKKADKLSMGHDSSVAAIATGRAKVCLLCADASERLKKEFARAASYEERNVPLVYMPFTLEDIKKATGRPAGVLTINDEGFARSFLKLEDNKTGGNSTV
jgi:ribosomal protein L7Ae-like RNA K-turn-binding protein